MLYGDLGKRALKRTRPSQPFISNHGKRVLIAGAGDAGKLVVKELFATSQLGLEPIGFVDSDASKHGHMLAGLPVFGPLAHIPEIVERFRALADRFGLNVFRNGRGRPYDYIIASAQLHQLLNLLL